MGDDFMAEEWILLVISLIFIGLRLYTRCSFDGFENLALDDFLMVGAGCVYAGETVLAYLVGQEGGLTNGFMTDEARAALDPSSTEWTMRVAGSKVQLAGWLVMIGLLWLLKLCMLIYYSRLTEGIDGMQIRVRIGYGVLATTFIATFCCIAFGCSPFHNHWQINPDPGNYCQPAYSRLSAYSVIFIDGSTDLFLMTLPLPVIWKARLPLRKRIMLAGLFSGGFIILAFAILRCVFMLQATDDGATQVGKWSIRESFVAVLVDNMPMIYPLFKRHLKSVFGSTNGSQDLYSLSSGQKLGTKSGTKSGTRSGTNKRKSVRCPLDLENTNNYGSKEHIVDPNEMGLESHVESDRTTPENSNANVSNTEDGKDSMCIHIVTELNIESEPAFGLGDNDVRGARYEDDFGRYATNAQFSPRTSPVHRREGP